RFPFVGRTDIGERERGEALRHLEDAREILRAFHVTRQPIEIVGGAREHLSIWNAASSIQDPGVLRSAALAGVDHERSSLQRHTGEAAWHDADAIAPGKHEWAQIDMAGRHSLVDAG